MTSPSTPASGRSSRRRSVGRLATVALFGLIAAACADDKPLNTFEPRSPQARNIDGLMAPIWWVMAVIFVLVIGGSIVLAIRNRVKPADYDPEDLPEQTHGNTTLELAWTLAPAILLAAICIPLVGVIWDLEEKNDPCGVGEVGPECDGLDVMVIGQQWWWEFRYDVDGDGFFLDVDGDGVAGDADDREWPLELSLDPDDIVTANELVLPADQQVDLLLTSRDVIHSFWIPRLNGKRDTVPGRWHTWSIQADDPGKYTGWCTEFCGLSHARMRMSAIVLDDDDFAAWWANQAEPAAIPTDDDAVAGRELFLNNCQRCHYVNDGETPVPDSVGLVAKAAPNLTHFATRTTFAGGIYGVYAGGEGEATVANDDAFPASDYLDIAELAADPDSLDDYRFNSAELKRWISNAPEQKDMYSEPDPETELARGMPAFTELSDEQLDQIVAYLATLD